MKEFLTWLTIIAIGVLLGFLGGGGPVGGYIIGFFVGGMFMADKSS
ncbi:MAG: hypothetical protein ACLQME_04780 [Alphaproteobacteria bacterium]